MLTLHDALIYNSKSYMLRCSFGGGVHTLLLTCAMLNSPMLVLDMSSRADSKTRRMGMRSIRSFKNFTWVTK